MLLHLLLLHLLLRPLLLLLRLLLFLLAVGPGWLRKPAPLLLTLLLPLCL
jgi:hypothetical protein